MQSTALAATSTSRALLLFGMTLTQSAPVQLYLHQVKKLRYNLHCYQLVQQAQHGIIRCPVCHRLLTKPPIKRHRRCSGIRFCCRNITFYWVGKCAVLATVEISMHGEDWRCHKRRCDVALTADLAGGTRVRERQTFGVPTYFCVLACAAEPTAELLCTRSFLIQLKLALGIPAWLLRHLFECEVDGVVMFINMLSFSLPPFII